MNRKSSYIPTPTATYYPLPVMDLGGLKSKCCKKYKKKGKYCKRCPRKAVAPISVN